MEDLPYVSSPRRILSLSKKKRATISYLDPGDKASAFGLSGEHGLKPSEIYGFVGSITTVVAIAILYVHDLSGECGTSTSDEFILYKEIKKRFGDHLWLDVVSKCDLLQSISGTSHDQSESSDLELEHYKKLGPVGVLNVSVKNELGLVELKDRVHKQLVSQMARFKDLNSNQEA